MYKSMLFFSCSLPCYKKHQLSLCAQRQEEQAISEVIPKNLRDSSTEEDRNSKLNTIESSSVLYEKDSSVRYIHVASLNLVMPQT